MKKKIIKVLKITGLVFLGIFLIGLVGSIVAPIEEETVSTPEPSITQEATPAPKPVEKPSESPTASSTPTPEVEEPEPDLKAQVITELDPYLQPHWEINLTDVEKAGDSLYIIRTDVVDPRGGPGDFEVRMMTEITCQAGERAFGDDKTIKVQEADDTTIATNLFGTCEYY